MIIGIILGVIILISMIAWFIGIARSRSSKTMKPEGKIIGKALIVYDPGLSGGTKTAADYMAEDLKPKGYEVKVAGVRSTESLETYGYDIMIIGSPNYGSNPTEPVTTYLNLFEPPEDVILSVYSLSGGAREATNMVMAQVLKGRSLPVKVSINYGHSAFGAGDKNKYKEFVSGLLG